MYWSFSKNDNIPDSIPHTPKFVRLTGFHACAEITFTNVTETYQSYLLDTVWTIDSKIELLYDAYLR